jgi:predicted kinase
VAERPVLIVLGGLPGTGKTSIARAVAHATGAVHLRIDTIEQALRDAGVAVVDQGYRVAYALAADHLRQGQSVIADSVNPIAPTRTAWRGIGIGEAAGARVLEVEIVCTDRDEHRRRVETRTGDMEGLVLPSWAEVKGRDYEPWSADLVIDTAVTSMDAATGTIVKRLSA